MANGTLLYAQSGGVTAVINATASAVIQAARARKVKVLAARNGILGALREDLIDTSKEPLAAIRALAHTPGGAFGSCRVKLKSLDADRARYERDRQKDLRLSRANGIDGVLKAHQLDAIITPGGAGAGLAARAGYPIIVVPFALVPNAPTPALPDGFDAKAAPFGVGFTGASCSEPRLIALAYAFEQATKRRIPPQVTP